MEEQELKKLISKYNLGTATPDERVLVENWYDDLNGAELSKSDEELESIKQDTYAALQTYIGTTSTKQYPAQNNIITLTYVKWIAAALLLSISITFYYYRQHSAQNNNTLALNDIAPGGNKAILTLADGSKLVLDDSKNGKLATQGKTVVQKTGSGMLSYLSAALGSGTAPAEVTYNTITTPRGGQYHVTLPDGTQVWLNAASSLKFPTAFNGKERDVELSGEAYFEVTKNKAMPFHVATAGQNIEVLGTHFDINGYRDEAALTTTLLEGSVKVTKGALSAMLRPGQQSAINNNETGAAIKVSEVNDVDEVTAWKNGKFHFNDTDIKTVMRQVSRWYDVDIEYTGKIDADDIFTGTFSRDMTLAKALKLLEFSGVNFKIEGRKIIVK